MSRFLALATVLLLTLTSVGLTEEPFTIGWIGPLTGDAAFLGVDSVDVAKRSFAAVSANEKLHGRKIRIVAEDDQYQTAKTISAYKKLVQIDHAKVIFVITYGGMIAVAPLAEKDNVLLIDPLDCDDELAALPKNSFCVAKKTEDLGITTAQHAISHNNFPAAIIYAEGDPFEPKVAKATKEIFETAGHPVVMFEGISGKSLDFRSLLLRAKELKAKSIFYYGYDDFGVAMKQARELRLEAVPYALTSINSPGFLAGAGDAANGTFVAGWFAPRTPAYEKFLTEHRASVGREPLLEVSTVPTYDMAQIIIDGLESLDFSSPSSSVAQLRDYFYSVKNFDGLSGKITMDPDGAVRTLKTGMYSYRAGKFLPEQ